MIRRLATSFHPREQTEADMWQDFVSTQHPANTFSACITQPAHAALAGEIAALLSDDAFEPLPMEVLQCIGAHDAGWAQEDLRALETSGLPASFLDVSPEGAVKAWRESIRLAWQHSRLSGIITSRHFCLLAPRDGDPAHSEFVTDETPKQQQEEEGCGFPQQALRRLTGALGFCDLLSLYLCSGRNGTVRAPLWHAADPLACDAPHVRVTVSGPDIRMDRRPFQAGSTLSVAAWTRTDSAALTSQRIAWRFF